MSSLKERLNAYEDLMRLKHPAGFFLLLWPTLFALWVASKGMPPFSLIVIVFMGCLLFRSAGCVLTVWQERTSPVMQGTIASWEAAALVAVLCLFVFGFIWLTTKTAVIIFFVALAFIAIYVLLRRAVILPQALLGIIFSLGIPSGFAIVLNEIPWQAWALMGVNFFWIVAYEIEDSIIGGGEETHSLSFGQHDIIIVAFCYFCFFAGIAFFGVHWQLGWPFWLCFATAVFVALSCLLCIKRRGRNCRVDSFRKNHLIGMALFTGIVADFVLLHQALPLWKM